MKILVTGGAGYIGSFMARHLLEKGFEVTVLDSLERGHKQAVHPGAQFIHADINDTPRLVELFKRERYDAIMHFAGYISVEESTRQPDLYQKNNVEGAKKLFDTAVEVGNIKKIIFSSTAAVYGNPEVVPIPEDHPKNPTSPYGVTKLAIEEYLTELHDRNREVGFVALRYFNAAGAALDGSLGEDHLPETHIIPLAIGAATRGDSFHLFGTDYETPDGTCVRDYIHVLDLAHAHLLALDKLNNTISGYFYNVGTGKGYSNREVINAVEQASGKNIALINGPRRAGDPDQLIADPSRINRELGFSPKHSGLQTIVESALSWYKNKLKI